MLLISTDACKVNKLLVKNAIEKSFEDYDKKVKVNFDLVIKQIEDLQKPTDDRINDIKHEADVLQRLNDKFIGLYR